MSVFHYGSKGTAECGADEPNMALTEIAAHVTCSKCRGWLPIVAPELQLPRGTSPPPGGRAATDVADWRTVAEAAAEIGCSKRTIERLAAAKTIESRLRPVAGSPAIAVYNPDDVRRIALERRPAAAAFVLPVGVTPHSNGNGHQTAEVAKRHFENAGSGDPIRQLAAAFERFLLSPPPPPVADPVAERPLLTLEETAGVLKVTLRRVRVLIRAGTLSPVKLSARAADWRIRRRDLEAL